MPERFVLSASITGEDANDVPRAVTEAIGYGRLTQTFRDEVGELVGMLYQVGVE